MPITDYHAKYFAHELTKHCASDSLEKLSSTLSNTQVDINPHQIEAALFAFRSYLSKGALLVDEVDARKELLIERVEAQLKQKTMLEPLLTVKWRVV